MYYMYTIPEAVFLTWYIDVQGKHVTFFLFIRPQEGSL